MAKVPPPPAPAWLAGNVQPVTREVPAGDLLWRIYKTAGSYPQAWNSFRRVGPIPGSRFDHHEPAGGPGPSARGILYAAADPTAAVAEAFQAARVIDRISQSPELAAFCRMQNLLLLDVSPGSMWAIRAGAAAAMQFGDSDLCQRWSRAIYEAYPDIHGLAYSSTMTGRPAFALYERAQPLLAAHPMMRRRLSSPSLTATLQAIGHDLGNWPIV